MFTLNALMCMQHRSGCANSCICNNTLFNPMFILNPIIHNTATYIMPVYPSLLYTDTLVLYACLLVLGLSQEYVSIVLLCVCVCVCVCVF